MDRYEIFRNYDQPTTPVGNADDEPAGTRGIVGSRGNSKRQKNERHPRRLGNEKLHLRETPVLPGSGANFKKGRRAGSGALGERDSLACQIGPKCNFAPDPYRNPSRGSCVGACFSRAPNASSAKFWQF